MEEQEKNKLLAAIAYSDGPKKGKEAPNLLGSLLSSDIPFDRDIMFWIYCYYSCGYSWKKIKDLLPTPYKTKEIEDLINNKKHAL